MNRRQCVALLPGRVRCPNGASEDRDFCEDHGYWTEEEVRDTLRSVMPEDAGSAIDGVVIRCRVAEAPRAKEVLHAWLALGKPLPTEMEVEGSGELIRVTVRSRDGGAFVTLKGAYWQKATPHNLAVNLESLLDRYSRKSGT